MFLALVPTHLASLPNPLYNWVTISGAFLLLIVLAVRVWIRRLNVEVEAEHLRRLLENLRRSQEAVRQSERLHREFVENAVYGIFRATDAGRFLDVNAAFVAMLGYSCKQEVLTLNLVTDVYVDSGPAALLHERTRENGRWEDIEAQWRRKDGTHLTVRLSGRVIVDCVETTGESNLRAFHSDCVGGDGVGGDGAVIECIVQDLTERQAMTSQIAALQKFEAIGQLAGGIAHDFNNVIGAIQSWAELAKEEAQPESSLQHRLQRLCNQTGRAAALTRQMLAVSRRQVLESGDLSLNDVVCEVGGFLKNLIRADIKVRTVLAPDLQSIYANTTQIEQVIMNLMLNARDAMPQGGCLTIETENQRFDDDFCRAHSWARSGRFACVSVTDSGCGMDPATREHIFEPFFTTKEVGKGTGLGLATVDRIVRDHGGWIHVRSELGHGTTFRVYLPVPETALETVVAADESGDPLGLDVSPDITTWNPPQYLYAHHELASNRQPSFGAREMDNRPISEHSGFRA
jgi:PAS domain S-box-containing protein